VEARRDGLLERVERIRRIGDRRQSRIVEAGGYVTEILDHDCFRSICFREPRGVLSEIATPLTPSRRRRPPSISARTSACREQHAELRAELERSLTPIGNPRTLWRAAA
jgi:hypothetical protein